MKCNEEVFGQVDFNVVLNVADEVVGVLCNPHMEAYVAGIEEDHLPPDISLARLMVS